LAKKANVALAELDDMKTETAMGVVVEPDFVHGPDADHYESRHRALFAVLCC